jgi:4-carboxymuconolactone decarboxylase
MPESTPEKPPSGAGKMLGDFAPASVHFTDDVLFGEVWKRPDLAPRDRSHLAFYTGWPQAMAAMAVAKRLSPAPKPTN